MQAPARAGCDLGQAVQCAAAACVGGTRFCRHRPARLGLCSGMSGARQLLADFLGRISGYRQQRDFPAVKGVSYLSVHLRFGTLSIRELVAEAIAAGALRPGHEGAATWLSELVWRDFYFNDSRSLPAGLPSVHSNRPTRPSPGARAACRAGLRRLVRRPYRLSASRCRDAPAQWHGLHAQSPAHADRFISEQGFGCRLAAR